METRSAFLRIFRWLERVPPAMSRISRISHTHSGLCRSIMSIRSLLESLAALSWVRIVSIMLKITKSGNFFNNTLTDFVNNCYI